MTVFSNAPQVAMDRCRNCGASCATNPSTLFTDKDLPTRCFVVQCACCAGHSYISGDDIALESLYSRKYFHGTEYYDYDASAPAFQRNFRRKIKIIQAYTKLPQELRVLEIGGATGEFFATMTESGSPMKMLDYLSIEVSEYARERANFRGARSISPFDPYLAESLQALRPNLIVAWDVWEHLEDPSSIFTDYLSYAGKELTIALTTVDSGALTPRIRGTSWRQFHPPTHLNYPTRKSFESFFDQHQLTRMYHRSFGSYRPLGEYTKVLPELVRRALPTAFRSVPIYCNTFDTQLVIAQRTSTHPDGM